MWVAIGSRKKKSREGWGAHGGSGEGQRFEEQQSEIGYQHLPTVIILSCVKAISACDFRSLIADITLYHDIFD